LKSQILTEIDQVKEDVNDNKNSISLSNSNSTSQFNTNVEMLIRQLNNMTVDMREISEKKLELKISTVEMKLESFSRNLGEIADKIKNLQNIDFDRKLELKNSSAIMLASSLPETATDNTTKTLVILMFILMISACLFVTIKIFFDNRRKNMMKRSRSETNSLREDFF
jgi:hypothetical protein